MVVGGLVADQLRPDVGVGEAGRVEVGVFGADHGPIHAGHEIWVEIRQGHNRLEGGEVTVVGAMDQLGHGGHQIALVHGQEDGVDKAVAVEHSRIALAGGGVDDVNVGRVRIQLGDDVIKGVFQAGVGGVADGVGGAGLEELFEGAVLAVRGGGVGVDLRRDDAIDDGAADAAREGAQGIQHQQRAIGDAVQVHLAVAQGDAQVLDVGGAFLAVVGRQVDPGQHQAFAAGQGGGVALGVGVGHAQVLVQSGNGFGDDFRAGQGRVGMAGAALIEQDHIAAGAEGALVEQGQISVDGAIAGAALVEEDGVGLRADGLGGQDDDGELDGGAAGVGVLFGHDQHAALDVFAIHRAFGQVDEIAGARLKARHAAGFGDGRVDGGRRGRRQGDGDGRRRGGGDGGEGRRDSGSAGNGCCASDNAAGSRGAGSRGEGNGGARGGGQVGAGGRAREGETGGGQRERQESAGGEKTKDERRTTKGDGRHKEVSRRQSAEGRKQ